MEQKILRVYLDGIMLNSNGVPPGWEDSQPHNLVVATLRYPRSGAPSVVSTKLLSLQSQREFTPSAAGNIWDRLLFKEAIEGETELQVKVLYHSTPSKAEEILKKLFGVGVSVLESVLGGVGVLGIILAGALGEIVDSVKQSGPEILSLGQTKPLAIKVTDEFTAPVALGLINATNRELSYFPPGSNTSKVFTIPANNGLIRLKLEWQPA
jgi:hypothetical protein